MASTAILDFHFFDFEHTTLLGVGLGLCVGCLWLLLLRIYKNTNYCAGRSGCNFAAMFFCVKRQDCSARSSLRSTLSVRFFPFAATCPISLSNPVRHSRRRLRMHETFRLTSDMYRSNNGKLLLAGGKRTQVHFRFQKFQNPWVPLSTHDWPSRFLTGSPIISVNTQLAVWLRVNCSLPRSVDYSRQANTVLAIS